MLIHKDCSTAVEVVLSPIYSIMGVPTIRNGDMSIRELRLKYKTVKTSKVVTEFFCPACEKIVEQEDLMVYCEHCDEILPTDQVFSIDGYPVMLCDAGVTNLLGIEDDFKKKKCTPVSNVIHTLKLPKNS